MTDTTFEVTLGSDYDLYTGAGVREPEERGLPIGIEGRGFMLDLSQNVGYYHRYQRTSVNLTNTQQANSGGDQAQVPPEVWRRSIESWDSGSGQERYDRDTSLPFRYRDSYRVDVSDPWHMSLLHDVAEIQALGGGRSFLTTVGPGQLFACAGSVGYWWTDLTVPPVTVTFGSAIVGVCSDGEHLYVLDSAGDVARWTDSGTSTTFATITSLDPTRAMLAYIKGYLVVGNGPELLDITDGTPTRIWLHPLDGFTWRDACDGLNAAYLIGGMGDRWQVLAMTPKADATTFDPPSVAAPLPDGEIGYAIASYLGYILIGVSTGWRFGVTDTSGKVTYGRLTQTHTPVLCFEGQDRFVWYGMNGDTSLTTAGLGRANLETFVGTLTPASAPDLSTSAPIGLVHACTTFAGMRVFTVDGIGVFAEQNVLAPDGWLKQGEVSYNTSDDKMGLYCDVFHEALHGSVALDIAYDDHAFSQIGANTNGGSVSMGHMRLATAFTHAELRYRLTADAADLTLGPVITRAEVRAVAVAGHATEWRLPLIINENIAYEGVTQARDIQSDYDLLIDLSTTKRPFALREYDRPYTAYVSDFIWLAEQPDQPGQTLQGTYILVCREVF